MRDLTFTVAQDELACIVGPSGYGKSTLLRCIAGLTRPTAGEITLHGNKVTGVPEDLAVVFQDDSRSLFPWLSVRGNVEFPLRTRVPTRAERRARALEALSWVGLPDAAGKYPWQLSGGMQQRVSIPRALSCQPALLLMDEPFASVDAQTRAGLEDLLLRVRREHNSTVPLVTHDIDESVYLGDRSAISMAFPAGSVASAVFAVEQFRPFGASRSTAAAATVLSGVVSVVGLCFLYAVGVVYLGIRLVRQIPLSLVAGLTLLGTDNATAAAATLGYRLLSCWLVIPVGLAARLALTRVTRRSNTEQDTPRLWRGVSSHTGWSSRCSDIPRWRESCNS